MKTIQWKVALIDGKLATMEEATGLPQAEIESHLTIIGILENFVFQKEFFRYLEKDNDCYLEKEPLEKLVTDKQLSAYRHNGFWQCMDTQRELDILNQLWATGKAPWKVWA